MLKATCSPTTTSSPLSDSTIQPQFLCVLYTERVKRAHNICVSFRMLQLPNPGVTWDSSVRGRDFLLRHRVQTGTDAHPPSCPMRGEGGECCFPKDKSNNSPPSRSNHSPPSRSNHSPPSRSNHSPPSISNHSPPSRSNHSPPSRSNYSPPSRSNHSPLFTVHIEQYSSLLLHCVVHKCRIICLHLHITDLGKLLLEGTVPVFRMNLVMVT